MSRWQPDARGRLERAAVDLFSTQGYAATTIPEIAARAGLTTRTFFRYFPDKREVIFDGDTIPTLARAFLAAAPAEVPPMQLLVSGMCSIADERFPPRREAMRRLRPIIAAEPALRERDARKRDDLTEAVRVGFVERGVSEHAASALAAFGIGTLHAALDQWLADDDTDLPSRTILRCIADVRRALDELSV
ncbi:TetR family transcriptional regulator [Curtobacterium ammoniigenes]|uniref:TetR family transcriptional regulator n=1 Tax=Curtobacterium ammoniigenes TaxID=395387 RepID=UPI00146FFCDE|nr:TetR family transcriptional regulator [Curtobacterium ammoniigenes]